MRMWGWFLVVLRFLWRWRFVIKWVIERLLDAVDKHPPF